MATSRRSRRIRTKEGRVLRVDGHTRRKASKLLRARRYAKRRRLPMPARLGNLSYQSAAWLLANGPKRGKRRRRRVGTRLVARRRVKSARPAARKRSSGQPGFCQWAADNFGGSQARRNPRKRSRRKGYRSPAQRAATKRMIAANRKRARTGRSGGYLRRNPGVRSQGDKHAAHELVLYAENDGDLYRQQKRPIELNLLRKKQKGTYRSDLSEKLWFYFATTAAKKYVKEFGSPGDMQYVFTAETRRMAAHQMRLNFESEYGR